mgnify:CR=1 FL=1
MKTKLCSPDILLIDKLTKKIIPVEIKCIYKNPEWSTDVLRDYKIAKLQLKSCADLLYSYYYGFSLLIICFIYNDCITKKYIFDIKYIKIIF